MKTKSILIIEIKKFLNYQDNRDLPEARKLAQDAPCVMLFGETGNDQSWSFRPFWWPVLVAPKNVPKTMYASKVAGEKLVQK